MSDPSMPESRDAFIIHKRLRHLRFTIAERLRALGGRAPERPRQRLIFTATNGRSGSNMLADLFGAFRDQTALHEPEPDFRHLRPFAASHPWLARQWLEYVKMPAIAATPGSVYVETSHMFCKGYFEPMTDLGYGFDLILLSRPARQIALSMVQLPSIPGTTRWADSFYVSPKEPNLLPLKSRDGLSSYQFCFWHALENEKRQHKYAEAVQKAGNRVAHIDTGDLSNREAVLACFQELQLDMSKLDEAEFGKLLGTRSNLKHHEKRSVALDLSRLDDEEAEVRERAAA